MKFNYKYFIAAILLFAIELFIALYVHDSFIRPIFGDVLVVILIYCFVKAFFNFNVIPLTIGVLIFSYLVEFSQYLNLVDQLELQESRLARIVLGSTFSWGDMLAYTVGCILILLVESFKRKIKT